MPRLADSKKITFPRAGPWAFRAMVVVFFLLFFLYVWLRIEPAVEYYSKGRLFSLSESFLHRFLDYPGGLAQYAAAFLAQLNHQSWLGALVFTALGALLFLMTNQLCRLVTGRAPLVVCLAPSLILLAWRGCYDGQTLDASLLLLLALGAALTGHLGSRRPVWLRWPVWWAIGVALYYAAGLWPFLLFLFLAGWFEAIQGRTWLKVAGVVFSGLLVPVAWHSLQFAEQNLNPWETSHALLFASLLFLLLPATLPILAWLSKPLPIPKVPEARPHKRGDSQNRNLPAGGWRLVLGKPAFAAGLLLAGWLVVWSLFDGTQKKLAQIEYYAAGKQDKRLLDVAAQLESMPPDAEVLVRLALYHTGRLTQDLFAFAHTRNESLLPGLSQGVETARFQIETLLELGRVNDAEHMAHESLEFDGERPDVLRALAKINILKNRPKAAAVFLNVLRRIPFQGGWASTWLEELARNPRLTGNPELDLIRSRMPTTDFPHINMSDVAAGMFRQLLASNPRNQMAFEYLMAQFLLSGELEKLGGQVERLDDFAYAEIPRPVEEALLLGQKLQGVQFELHGLTIRPETNRRFRSFCDVLGGATGPSRAAFSGLAADFGDTYWYYYYSRPTPQPDSPE
jgi:hypothetical protein